MVPCRCRKVGSSWPRRVSGNGTGPSFRLSWKERAGGRTSASRRLRPDAARARPRHDLQAGTPGCVRGDRARLHAHGSARGDRSTHLTKSSRWRRQKPSITTLAASPPVPDDAAEAAGPCNAEGVGGDRGVLDAGAGEVADGDLVLAGSTGLQASAELAQLVGTCGSNTRPTRHASRPGRRDHCDGRRRSGSARARTCGSSSLLSSESEPMAVMCRPLCSHSARTRGSAAGVVVTTSWAGRTASSGLDTTQTARPRICRIRFA